MTTARLEVRDLLSPLSAAGVERMLRRQPGVMQAEVNPVSGSATLVFDDAATTLEHLQQVVRACGHHCLGAPMPEHLCAPAPTQGPEAHGHTAHAHGQAAHAQGQSMSSHGHPAPTPPGRATPAHDHAAPAHSPADAMDHSMGHGAGMDMAAMVRDMRNRFLVALAFTLPLMAVMPMGMDAAAPHERWRDYAAFVLATGAVIYPGWPFYRSAVQGLRVGTLNMATLVLLSVGTGYAFSIGATFLWGGATFYEASSMLMVFILLGHWLEMRARAGASEAVRALLDLAPPKAFVERDGVEREVSTAEVVVGDLVVMKPGGKLPVDGEVVDGGSEVDESMLTGESMPVRKGHGDKVIGATINRSGSFRYRATRVGADTALAQIVRLVRDAQDSKAPAQRLADRAAQWLVVAAIVVGLATFAFWFALAGKGLLFALTLAITVFVIACPDALGLAMPMAVMVGTGLGAKHGILFKHAAALEQAAKLDVVVFDKTGTLTLGRPEVIEVVAAEGRSADEVLEIAAALETRSEHPLALAILTRAKGLAQRDATGFENIDGRGARAEVDGVATFVGSRRLMEAEGFAIGGLAAASSRLQGDGRTVVHVGQQERVLGLIAIADAPRPTARAAVAKLRERGVRVAMLTWDNLGTATRVAAELGIDTVLADVLPGDKAAKVRELQAGGARVGMVGDGINDAPALTQADVGFAVGAGADVAMESAEVVLMKSDPLDVVVAIEISRATLSKMRQNLAWAVLYNVIAFPLAAGVLYPMTLSPEVAALSMSGSTVLVAVNALMLKRARLPEVRAANAVAA